MRYQHHTKTGTDEAPALTVAQRREIREAFDLFDADGSGDIDEDELNIAIQTLGFDPHRPEMEEVS